ncbi:MAG: HNH endonuclease [Leifsonia sp.]
MARRVKRLYKDACQLCGVQIIGIDGRTYSEGAHVRPLGRPHLGPDVDTNILCLCPNHHTQLDVGGILIQDDMSVAGTDGSALGSLTFVGAHQLLPANVEYHRELWKSRR